MYANLGMKVSQNHRILKIIQEKWMEPYIALNTEMRSKSTNINHESFYRVMNTSWYGKALDSKRNPVNVKLPRTREGILENSGKSLVTSVEILDENHPAAIFRKGHIFSDPPTIVAACILDLAKYHMFYFH